MSLVSLGLAGGATLGGIGAGALAAPAAAAAVPAAAGIGAGTAAGLAGAGTAAGLGAAEMAPGGAAATAPAVAEAPAARGPLRSLLNPTGGMPGMPGGSSMMPNPMETLNKPMSEPMKMLGQLKPPSLGGIPGSSPISNPAEAAIPELTQVPKDIPKFDYQGSTAISQPNGVDWAARMKDAHQVLRFASMLTKNKKDKQTLNLMAMGTGLGASNGDLSSPEAQQMLSAPLQEIAKDTQEEEAKQQQKMSQVISPLQAPSTMQQPRAPVNANVAPTTARGAGPLPPARLAPDLVVNPRLREIYGY